jgi:hypothetical protein
MGLQERFREAEHRVAQGIILSDRRGDTGSAYPIPVVDTIEKAQNDLASRGFTLVSDAAFGVDGALTHELTDIFNTPGIVVPAENDHPIGRERARYAIDAMYLDAGGTVKSPRDKPTRTYPEFGVHLEEADNMTVVTEALINIRPEDRPDYSQVPILKQYPIHSRYIAGLLAVAAAIRTSIFASVGINEFRAKTIATEVDHSDFAPEEDAVVAIRVNWRNCDGARTQLLPLRSPVSDGGSRRPLLSVELQPGGVTLVFRDSQFLHRATTLMNRPGNSDALREATIMTIQTPKPHFDATIDAELRRRGS